MKTAIVRHVSPSVSLCELTHLEREPVSYDIACAQHALYVEMLERHGWNVVALPADPDLPDCAFVEDTVVVTDERAVLTCPGATSRRHEVEDISDTIASFRPVSRIESPATLDGGDVLVIGREIWVGRSSRTNAVGIAFLASALEPHGYAVRDVDMRDCLHLKSAVTSIGTNAVVLNPEWIDQSQFSKFEVICVHPDEPAAANVLDLTDVIIVSDAYPRTRERLEQYGLTTESITASELAKAEGGLTCCSVLIRDVD